MKTEDIVSDLEIHQVHGNANFGGMSRRRVVDLAVLKYAMGYSSGSTALAIVREHGLVGKPRGYQANLTKKGRAYLRALMAGRCLDEVLDFLEGKALS